MSVEVRIFEGPEALADAVAAAFVARLARPGAPAPRLQDVALTGGTIARSVHRAIARQADDVDWSQVRLWFGDERFVAADSAERNYNQAREDLIDQLIAAGLPEGNVCPVPAVGEARNVHEAAQIYADRLRHDGSGSWAIVMLGMGPDGHVASLFPHHPATATIDAITVAVTDSPKPPPERVSLTFEALLRHTGAVWFLVSGADKADAVARALADQGSVEVTPARGIAAYAEPATDIVWWLDQAAASQL